MYNLIAKDLRLQKILLIISTVLVFFFVLLEYGLVFTVVAIAINYVINVHFLDNRDESNKGHRFMNSLPYSRRQIILSKYISIVVMTLVTVVVTLIVQLLINVILPSYSVDIGTYKEIWISFIIVLLFATIYLPTFYRFRNKNLLSGFTMITLVVLLLWWKIEEWLNVSQYMSKVSAQLSMTEIITYTSIAAVVLYIVSYLLTVKIYERIDF
jgi:ABC-2 type transport system permease protein